MDIPVKRKRGRPKKTDIVAKTPGKRNAVGRPKGEQAIINEAHERGMVVPNRKQRLTDEDTQAAGAYVAYPEKGIHDWKIGRAHV